MRKRVKKALSQSLFGMSDCVTYTLRSCEGTIFRLHIRKRNCGSSIPHVSLFFLISDTVKCCYFFQDALKRNSARQIRFAFLLHAWNATLDYSENVLREAEQTDKLFNVRLNFCHYSTPWERLKKFLPTNVISYLAAEELCFILILV